MLPQGYQQTNHANLWQASLKSRSFLKVRAKFYIYVNAFKMLFSNYLSLSWLLRSSYLYNIRKWNDSMKAIQPARHILMLKFSHERSFIIEIHTWQILVKTCQCAHTVLYQFQIRLEEDISISFLNFRPFL